MGIPYSPPPKGFQGVDEYLEGGFNSRLIANFSRLMGWPPVFKTV